MQGEQYELILRDGDHPARAVITEVGAALRFLSVDGVELTPGFDDDATPPFYSGKVLLPWPNRVRDGHVTERSNPEITLGANVCPQPGYPIHLDTEVRYTLVTDGLRVRHTVHNRGDSPGPRRRRRAPVPDDRRSAGRVRRTGRGPAGSLGAFGKGDATVVVGERGRLLRGRRDTAGARAVPRRTTADAALTARVGPGG